MLQLSGKPCKRSHSSGVSRRTTLAMVSLMIGLSFSWAVSVVDVPSVVMPLWPLRSESKIGCSWLAFRQQHPPPHESGVRLARFHCQRFHSVSPLLADRCKRPAHCSYRDALPDSASRIFSGNSYFSKIITTVRPAFPDREWQHPQVGRFPFSGQVIWPSSNTSVSTTRFAFVESPPQVRAAFPPRLPYSTSQSRCSDKNYFSS